MPVKAGRTKWLLVLGIDVIRIDLYFAGLFGCATDD